MLLPARQPRFQFQLEVELTGPGRAVVLSQQPEQLVEQCSISGVLPPDQSDELLLALQSGRPRLVRLPPRSLLLCGRHRLELLSGVTKYNVQSMKSWKERQPHLSSIAGPRKPAGWRCPGPALASLARVTGERGVPLLTPLQSRNSPHSQPDLNTMSESLYTRDQYQ